MEKIKEAARAGGKREEVLAVASECFLKKGFDGTSINVMAREACISKESIYRYFGSKEDLFFAVVERELEVYKKNMAGIARDYDKRSLKDALCQMVEASLKILLSDRTLALRLLIFQMSAEQPKVGAYYFEVGPRAAYENVHRVLKFHIDKFGLKTRYDLDTLSRYFISLALHSITLERECGVTRQLSAKELRRRCQLVVDDFLAAFFEPNSE